MDAFEFIVNEGLILIPVLYIIGEVIRNSELLSNKWIPLFLLLVSLGFSPWVMGGYTADNLVQAILIAGATVFGNELIKQTVKG